MISKSLVASGVRCLKMRGTSALLGLIGVLGLYLATLTIVFTDRVRKLEQEVADSQRKLKERERELYAKQLQLGDKEKELRSKSDAILGVSDKLHDAADMAQKAAARTVISAKPVIGRPKFIFNIGPMKTGSTTLQNYGASDRMVLRKDSYVWPASPFDVIYTSITPSVECLLHPEKSVKECPPFHEDRLAKFKTYLSRNKHLNAYLCDEMFGVLPDTPYVWQQLEFMKEDHDVELVVTYRRYFEWWVSFYVQAFKYDQEEEQLTQDWPSKPLSEVHDVRYNNHVKPHHEYFEIMKTDETSIFMRRWGIKHGEMHPTEAQKNRFEPHFPNIKVFNYHLDGDNLVGSFYCNMLPGAKSACEARTRLGTKAHFNSAVNHNYDILAVAAYEQGLIQKEHPGNTRKQMAAAAQHRQEKMLNLEGIDFPMICMSESQLEELLQMSLKFERQILPEWAAQHEEEHRAAFKRYVDKKKFCTIDADQVLKDDEWRSFFRYLRLRPEPKPKDEKADQNKVLVKTPAESQQERRLIPIPGTNRMRVYNPKNADLYNNAKGRPAANIKPPLSFH